MVPSVKGPYGWQRSSARYDGAKTDNVCQDAVTQFRVTNLPTMSDARLPLTKTNHTEVATSWTAPDGTAIYGYIRSGDPAAASYPLTIVNVHGITGHCNEVVHFNSARHFVDQGWTHVRFDLYGAGDGARRLDNVAISEHGQDLDVVLADVKRRFPGNKIVVIGHSLGVPTALLAREPFDALVSWDGAHSAAFGVLEDLDMVESINKIRWRSRVDHLLAPQMIDELRQLDCNQLMRNAGSRPTLVVTSDDEPLRRHENAMRYLNACNGPKELVTIASSNHTFTNDGNLEHLLATTTQWIRDNV